MEEFLICWMKNLNYQNLISCILLHQYTNSGEKNLIVDWRYREIQDSSLIEHSVMMKDSL